MKSLIIDTNSLASQAYYAKGGFSLFLDWVNKLAQETSPDNIYFCFDGEDNFRNSIYPEYKAQRSEDEERQKFLMTLHDILEKVGFAVYRVKSFEADDICATLAKILDGKKYVVSADKDLWQLVSKDCVIVYTAGKFRNRKTITQREVKERMGVRADQVVGYKSLAGDSSDNIKGVHLVGPVGAKKLLRKYPNLASIYKNLELIEDHNLQTNLFLGKDDAFMYEKIVRLREDVPIEIVYNFPKNTRNQVNSLIKEYFDG